MTTETLKQSFTTNSTEKHPLHAETESAYNAGDLDRWTSLYEENALLCTISGDGFVVGQQQIRKTLEPFLALGGSLTAKTVYSVENDDLLLLRGIFALSYTDEDGRAQQMITHSIEVAKRGSDGLWRFIIDHPAGAGQCAST
jgi:uncharacterized protein (TIGR02246 family)